MKTTKYCLAIALSGLVSACATTPVEPLRATAQLQPTKGNKTLGEVTFEQIGAKVHVFVNVEGLKPGQEHGFHIHEAGDCSSGDGMSARGHFDPSGKPHGRPGSGHLGDLPALKAQANGRAKLDFETTAFTLSAGSMNVVGRGLIIHADPDDYKTQPTGNSGARLACGVIRLE